VTVAVLEFPFCSTKSRREELLAPAASFQLLRATTPANSELAMGVVSNP
jgi:hypothetical protein